MSSVPHGAQVHCWKAWYEKKGFDTVKASIPGCIVPETLSWIPKNVGWLPLLTKQKWTCYFFCSDWWSWKPWHRASSTRALLRCQKTPGSGCLQKGDVPPIERLGISSRNHPSWEAGMSFQNPVSELILHDGFFVDFLFVNCHPHNLGIASLPGWQGPGALSPPGLPGGHQTGAGSVGLLELWEIEVTKNEKKQQKDTKKSKNMLSQQYHNLLLKKI